jgi:hypothetical protein
MKQLGVEMTVLRHEDRRILMRGMILRRLRLRELNLIQVGVGFGEDINEIRKKFSTFDFEAYTGLQFQPFLEEMISDALVTKEFKEIEAKGDQEAREDVIYGPGKKIPDFESALTEDMEWFIDDLPMSTRGLFDNMLNDPSRKVTVNIDDVIRADGKEGERIVEDTRDLKGPGDQLRAGPTGKL